MNLGNLKLNANGFFVGKIATVSVAMTICLRPWEARKENSPRFEILGLTPARTWVRVGFLFEQSMKDTGEAFLQGSIDDPSMSKPLYIACFREDDGSYNVAWSRPRRARNDLAPIGDAADGPADEGDGLGESTAPAGDLGLPPVEPSSRRGRRAEQAQEQQQEETASA
ncbi:DUF736 domain-containing protein [Aurantiacibacter xanthus]|jgi:uncharacterized protein (DUF736 family)|uniref:DUF736 domain-containing protein n=1 Tax=Aurantiacibacter xanthus TaxID=1784712 RepID=A0A3A1P320_9SPHN|nr:MULTISPECIES: DUF736 domain-containing protein [Sphingomonadales]RIV84872.1 DUF736 domain-containing protein [Aurantiacibacter xanthus]